MPQWARLKDALCENSDMRAIKLYSSSEEEEKVDIMFSIKAKMKQSLDKKKKQISVRLGKSHNQNNHVGIQMIKQCSDKTKPAED